MNMIIKKNPLQLLLVLLAVATSCAGHKNPEQDLMQADRDFSALSAQKGMNRAFLDYCAAEAVLLREGSMPVEGRDAIRQLLESRPDTAFTLTWEPLFARVAASGELGYTYGTFSTHSHAGGQVSRGTYVSIWILENGRWKWVLDSGNQGLGKELTSSL